MPSSKEYREIGLKVGAFFIRKFTCPSDHNLYDYNMRHQGTTINVAQGKLYMFIYLLFYP